MSTESPRGPLFVRYLLGGLPSEEQEDLEERYFSDPDLHEELRAASDDLIDDYLSGRLSADDRKRFEEYFLRSPRQRRRLELVRAVAARFQAVEPQVQAVKPRRSAWWLAAAVVVIVAAGLVVLRSGREAAPPPRVAQSAPPVATAVATPRREKQVVSLPAAADAPVAVTLEPEADHVRFEVPIENRRHPTFDAALKNAAGDTVWSGSGLSLAGPGLGLVVLVPVDLLAGDGTYTLHVDGEPLRGAPRRSPLSLKYTLRISRGPTPQRPSP